MTSTLTKPTGLTVITSNIPDEQKNRPQWVTWTREWVEGKDGTPGKWDKPPRNARTGDLASTTNSATWSTFADAVQAYEMGGYDGIGYVVAHDDPFFVADLDHCIVNGKVSAMARSIVDRTRAYLYWEVSPSGTGLRAIGIGTFPQHRKKNDVFEVYRTARYVTMTGHVFEGCNQISGDATAVITTIHQEQFGDPPTERTGTRQTNDSPADDIEVIERLRRFRNGAAFERLMQGSTADHDGDDSRADASLIERLLWASGGDVEQAVRIASTSMLWREKWESKRGDTDYIHYTAERILATMSDFYQPHYGHVTPTLQPPVSGETVCLSVVELSGLHARIATLEAENSELRALASRTASIRRNVGLRGSKDTAAALSFDLAGQQPDEDGYFQVSYPKMAESAGVSDDTIARDLKRFAKAGLIDRETRRILHERPNPETGEIVKTIEPRVFVKPAGNMTPIELAEQFAAIDVREFRKVEPRPCPVCKADAGTTVRHTETCNGCGAEVAEWQTERQPASDQTADRKPQLAVYEPLPSPVVVSKLPQLAVHATKAPQGNPSTASPDRKPHNAVYPPGGLVDLVRDTAPDRNAAAWFARESEHQRFLENSIAVGD